MNEKKARNELFQHLKTVITLSQKKFETNNKVDHSRLAWGRLIVQACSAYGKLLDNAELTAIQNDIDKIKEKLELGYGNKTASKGIKIH